METPPPSAAPEVPATRQPLGITRWLAPDAALPVWALPLLVAGITSLTYSVSLYFGFVYDDRVQILNNPWLASWKNVSFFFSKSTGAFTGNPGGSFWRPLFLLWMLLNRTIFGFRPWGWHLTTVALHAAAAVLVYLLASRILRNRFLAGFGALLFGVYPVTIESAAWISGATDPLMAIFLLAAFLVYLRAWDSQSRHLRAFSLLIYVLALMVKETAVVLPLLVLGHAWLYRAEAAEKPGATNRGGGRSALRWFLPYAAFSGIYLVERSLVLMAGRGNLASFGWSGPRSIFNLLLSPGELVTGATGTMAMILTWPKLVWFYLRLLFFPNAISPHYNLRAQWQFGVAGVLLPALALVALFAALAWGLRKVSRQTRHQLWFALIWIFVPILPVMYIRPMAAGDFAHIRYLYLSVIGLALLAAVLIGRIPAWNPRPNWSALQIAAAVVLLVVATACTVKNELYWRDNLTLFAHAVDVAPQNARARTNFAVELGERRQFEKAVEQFQKGLQIEPDLWYANVDLGYTYYLMGRYDEAIHWMLRGIEINPRDANQYTFLAAAQIRAGRLQQAEQSMRSAVERAPSMPSYHYALGLILEKEGKSQEAQDAFRQELEVNPGNSAARAKLDEAGTQGK
jgi:tetratricopeptide (TPR) repeat protein